MSVAVVTDSTAYLPDEVVGRSRITVLPLAVSISGREDREGIDFTPADVARALSERRVSVTTSRPNPTEFVDVYRRLLAAGASGVVSVHLSAHLSGTCDSARLAAEEVGTASARVEVVDAGSAGMGVGFPALAAAVAAAQERDTAGVRDAAVAAAARTATLFYVDTLEFMRRSGRIGVASALLGTALAVKPILHVVEGQVVLKEKVRTAGRALVRLVDLAVEAAGESDVDIAVHHLAAPARAEDLQESLKQRLDGRIRNMYLSEVGAVVAAHVGPGLACVVVHRL